MLSRRTVSLGRPSLCVDLHRIDRGSQAGISVRTRNTPMAGLFRPTRSTVFRPYSLTMRLGFESHRLKNSLKSLFPGVIPQAAAAPSLPDLVSQIWPFKIETNLVQQLFSVSIAYYLRINVEELSELILILGEIENSTHWDFKIAEANLGDSLR